MLFPWSNSSTQGDKPQTDKRRKNILPKLWLLLRLWPKLSPRTSNLNLKITTDPPRSHSLRIVSIAIFTLSNPSLQLLYAAYGQLALNLANALSLQPLPRLPNSNMASTGTNVGSLPRFFIHAKKAPSQFYSHLQSAPVKQRLN